MEKKPWDIHFSVLLKECIEHLHPHPEGIYVDGTLGMGGHTEAILKKSSPSGRVVGFEWDEDAIAIALKRLDWAGCRFQLVRRNFAEIVEGLEEIGVQQVDGILIDIGVSSLQLNTGKRGFSFMRDEPLDMRMDSSRKQTAETILKSASEQELADIFFYYGEERQARRIASAVVEVRKREPIRTTGQFAQIVSDAIPKRFHPRKIHVATKVFQGLRIAVNGELENLARILDEGTEVLKPGAAFCVISFHSLEDRIVKRKFRENQKLEVVTQRPLVPTAEELALNKRSRSARLRVARKKV